MYNSGGILNEIKVGQVAASVSSRPSSSFSGSSGEMTFLNG